MKIPPKRTRFFKPILPGFLHGLSIPLSFMNSLERHEWEHGSALFKRGGRKWKVEINGGKFEDGWQKFAEEIDLRIGDFMVFKHEGALVFDVMPFDHSHCEKEHPLSDDANEVDPSPMVQPKEESCLSSADTSPAKASKQKRSEKILKSKEGNNCEQRFGLTIDGHPYFIFTVTRTTFHHGMLEIPLDFARSTGLSNRCCEMILKDRRQRSWCVGLEYGGSHVHIVRGWRKFQTANGLMEGDQAMFELIDNGKKPVAMIYDQKHDASATNLNGTGSSSLDEEGINCDVSGMELKRRYSSVDEGSDQKAHPYFLSKVESYTTKWSRLVLPIMFARCNALTSGKIILKDHEDKLWSFNLVATKTMVCVRGNFREFFIANGIKEGCSFKLELIKRGKTPTFKFRRLPMPRKRRKNIIINGLDKPSSLDDDGHPYFVSKFRPYSIHQGFQVLPRNFAESNLLFTRNQMTLIDEAKRSWSVRLAHVDGHSHSYDYIGVGWRKFCAANGFKIGDSFKFKLIHNGKIPVACVHLC